MQIEKALKIINKLEHTEDIKNLKDLILETNDYISEIKYYGNKLRKLPYGVGGQSIKIQILNNEKGKLGVKILNAIKEYEEWRKENGYD